MTQPLWTVDEIKSATGGEVRGDARDVSGISIDSRTLEQGEAYFAILGDVHDGHKFVGAAHSCRRVACASWRAGSWRIGTGRS